MSLYYMVGYRIFLQTCVQLTTYACVRLFLNGGRYLLNLPRSQGGDMTHMRVLIGAEVLITLTRNYKYQCLECLD
jgi:hypothetical protein